MLTLSSTLTTAQKSASRSPYVELKAYEKIADVDRLYWSSLYSGSGLEYKHGAIVANDGSLLRAVVRLNGTQFDLDYQRITTPDSGDPWTSWSYLVAIISGTAGVSFSRIGSTVRVYYVGSDNITIYYVESTDDGINWNGYGPIATAGATIIGLAAVVTHLGQPRLFYSTSNNVYVTTYSGGSWSTPAAWTNSLNTTAGIDALHTDDASSYLVIAGTDTNSRAGVWTTTYNGSTWTALAEVISADANTTITYTYPSLAYTGHYRISLVENYSGVVSYNRVLLTHSSYGSPSFATALWREPWPLNLTRTYGAHIRAASGTAYLSHPTDVRKATVSTPVLDLTANLSELTIEEREEEGAELTVKIHNGAGTYLDTASGKGQRWIGTQLEPKLGYRTTAGAEVVRHRLFYVIDYTLDVGTKRSDLALKAVDAWGLLAHWKARRQYVWPADTTIRNILKWLLGRCGFDLNVTSASTASTLSPSFTIDPGETGLSAVRRLMAMIPDSLTFQAASGILKNRASADSSDYSYGGAHAIIRGSYSRRTGDANRAQVYSGDAVAEAFSWAEVDVIFDRVHQTADKSLTGGGSPGEYTQDRANAQLRKLQYSSRRDRIAAPVNCGLELYDVIDITETRAGLSAAKRRVMAIKTTYNSRQGIYTQELTAGEV